MIANVPTSENMNKLALRLHFGAWSDLLAMEFQFDEVFDPDSEFDWSQERAEYFIYCQPELQTICTAIQQSNELALKARVCEVSPYLLLLNSDPSLSTTPKDIDFAMLRTLDAVDLPAAVNSLCPKKISGKFIQTYNQIRSYRNQIAHLGATNKEFRPRELLHLLVAQYLELWPERAWLKNCVEFAAQTRTAFFHDGKYATAHSVAMGEVGQTFDVLTGAEFKALFGRSKTTRRYRCHECMEEASTKWFDARNDGYKTAFVEPDGNALYCIMCGKTIPVVRIKCTVGDCRGNVVSEEGEYAGVCHSCGKAAGDGQQSATG